MDRLLHAGYTVKVIDCLDERVHHGTVPKMPKDVELIRSRYGNTPSWRYREASVIVHLAAQVSVSDSAVDPGRYITQNSLETARFLHGLTDAPNVERLVVASSMSVYGEGGIQVAEDRGVCPASVYGLTKYDQECLSLIWGQQEQKPVAALRFFNVYGEGQALDNPYTGVLANFAKKLLRGESPVVYEDGQQTRDFIHVSDVADAVFAAIQCRASGVFNVCTGQATSIADVAKKLAVAMGCPTIQPIINGQTRPGDIRHCTGNPGKMRAQMSWEAQVTVDEGLARYGKALTRV